MRVELMGVDDCFGTGGDCGKCTDRLKVISEVGKGVQRGNRDVEGGQKVTSPPVDNAVPGTQVVEVLISWEPLRKKKEAIALFIFKKFPLP